MSTASDAGMKVGMEAEDEEEEEEEEIENLELEEEEVVDIQDDANTPMPRKPISSFFLFMEEHRVKQQSESGGTAASVTKVLAERWRNLTPEEKLVSSRASSRVALVSHPFCLLLMRLGLHEQVQDNKSRISTGC